MSDTAPPPANYRGWYHPVALARGLSIRPKLYLAVAAAIVAIYAAPEAIPLKARAVIGWNSGAAVYLLLAVYLMSSCSFDGIRKRAAQEDETRFVFVTLILLAIVSSFWAVVGLIGEAKTESGTTKSLYFALAGLAIFQSWLVMQVVFTLHYAHEFYWPAPGSGSPTGGLTFPGDDRPDYWDFFYFTTSIGATSQTSDVSITSKSLRRTVAFQAIVSFVFNTTVIALAINLAAGFL